MGKKIVAIGAGYVVMSIFVMVVLIAAFIGIGVDSVFETGTYQTTPLWLTTMSIVGLVAALIGGFVTVMIAKDRSVSLWLAGFVFVLGIGMAIPVLTAEETTPEVRPDGIEWFDAMQKGKQPNWIAILNPFLGALGALAGGRLKKS